MRKLISMVCSFAVFMTLFVGLSLPITVSAETSGDFEYIILEDGTAEITGYTGSDAELIIPSELDGYTVTSIGSQAFEYCEITSVSIANTVSIIGSHAFLFCESLESITIPASVIGIGASAFAGCISLTSFIVEESNIAYCSENDVLFNKEKTQLIKYSAKKPNTTYCIPDGVESIGDGAFSDCASLISITIPYSVTRIGYGAFSDCVSLTGITIPDGVVHIDDWTFSNCSSLTAVNLPDSVTGIGSVAFGNCTSLMSIDLPDNLITIGDFAFDYCLSLAEICLPDNVISIGEEAFAHCVSLARIILSNNLTSIGYWAFRKCESLVNITLPDSLTSIGDRPFDGCTLLTSIDVDEKNSEYCSMDGVLFNKEKTQLIQYPEGKTDISYCIPSEVTSIAAHAFSGCEAIMSITFPNGVTSIGDWSFGNCSSLMSITFPSDINSIGDEAFYECGLLVDVFYAGDQEQWNAISIGSNNSDLTNATIHFNTLESHLELLETISELTCTQSGEYVYTCSCGYTMNRIIPASWHKGSALGVVDPTCTLAGYTRYECNKCGDEYKDDWIDPLGHTGTAVQTISPTCEEWGYTEYYCSVCEQTYQDDWIDPGHTGTAVKTLEPTCTETGYTEYVCSACEQSYYDDYTATIGHTFENDVCVSCRKHRDDCIESKHDYDNDCDETWTVYKAGAVGITVTFSQNTNTEYGYDFIYIYDKNDNLIGQYSGSELAGETITVSGDTIKIRLTSDSSYTYYGFAVTNVQAQYEFILGDLDADGAINAVDAASLFYAVNGVDELMAEQLAMADVTGDGKVGLADAVRLFYIASGLI